MYTAKIVTESRQLSVEAEKDLDGTIRNLINAVQLLQPEDGKCQFIVCENGEELCSWSYSPTFTKKCEEV